MVAALEDARGPLIYIPKFREHALLLEGGPMMHRISYCPWCGEELPTSLRDRFFDHLETMGLEPEDPDVPVHFRSDAWWKLGPGAER